MGRAGAESRVRPSRPHASQPTPRQVPTFRCSAALRGLFGVLLALAGAPASGEGLGFPGVSAGMVRPRASGARRRAPPGAGGRVASVLFSVESRAAGRREEIPGARLFKAARPQGV